MIDLERKLKQKCVYWAVNTFDEFGKITFEEPVEISCRWEDNVVLFVDSTGESRPSKAIVYLVTDTDLTGWLWKGTLVELDSDYNDPRELKDAQEIKGRGKIPSLNNENVLRVVYL
jgi:hypothetical protein